ncbi:MBL fold metallo-hydrolase [Cytophaga sp. FL35]|uniref:MBL fold metallo-hydrolase n=1 Tax=Cytophaga sp. FL35 TaxID=1904456 RepID=UPI00165350A3|nr:MBL fold metallo-hydrolase [Cytophaga sp. FL35]MBC6997018.1 MBL fold metallo-hydrolase [Cytophaga sp. FL35]
MKIHQIRNATLIIEVQDKFILVDPMLGGKGTAGPTFTLFRFKPQRNPIVGLPQNAEDVLAKTTHCILTHLHPDHLDKAGEAFLKKHDIPVSCSVKDEKELLKRGLNVQTVVDYWKEATFLDGTLEGIPARHGYGFVARPMGNVMGYMLRLPKEKSVYLSSDTIYTDAVKKVLSDYKPDVSVVAAGSAQLDVFKPLLMTKEDVLQFCTDAPGKVIANHLEAVNHCPTTREELNMEIVKRDIKNTLVPNDGEVMLF